MQALIARTATWHDRDRRAAAHHAIANFYRRDERPDLRLVEAEKIIELQPDSLLGYGHAIFSTRLLEGESAIEDYCDRMAKLVFDEPGEVMDRAEALENSCHRTDQALADYSRAIELAPHWAEPYLRRGALYSARLNEYDKAIADYGEAMRLAPSWVSPVFFRAQTFMAQERFEEGLADIERCVEMGSDGNNLRWEQAQALLRLGRESDAFATLDDWLAENPEDYSTLIRKADAQFWLGRVDEAIALLDEVIEARPGDGPYPKRARYATFLEDACGRVEKDLEKIPETWTQVHAYLHTLSLHDSCPDLYDPVAALDFARRALATDSSYPYQFVLGAAAYRNAKYEEARDALLAALKLTESKTAPSQLSFFLAMTFEKLGETDEAHRWYERAVARMDETYPENPELVALRREATRILGGGR